MVPMSSAVHVDFRKWPDSLHWQFTMSHLGEDEHGTWLWGPVGMEIRRGHEPHRATTRLTVKLVTPDAWWTAIWNDSDDDIQLYVDIATPAEWQPGRVRMIDLDLDVVRFRDGRVEVLDEDEFAEHQVTLGYPPHIIDRARATTAAVFLDVQAGARRSTAPASNGCE